MHYFRRPIPKGYRIYSSFQVAGVHLDIRRSAIDRFMRGDKPEVSLRPEPDNQNDKNAILVVGAFEEAAGGTPVQQPPKVSVALGYVPRRDAEALQVSGVLPHIILRLNAISELGENWLSIEIDALGPKEASLSDKYFDFMQSQLDAAPANPHDVLFIQLAEGRKKRGLSHREANKKVEELRASLEKEAPSREVAPQN